MALGEAQQAAALAQLSDKELAEGLRALADDYRVGDPDPVHKLIALTLIETAIRLEKLNG